jgi:cytochrome c oxidase subunit IV
MSDHDIHSAHAHGPITRAGDIPLHDDHDHAGHEHEHAHDQGHGGIGKYLLVFLALCGLTTMSFLTYSSFWPWRDQPHVGWAFMMAVSCTKAMLVVLFFMHVFWEANWKYVLTIPAAMMAIFLALMLVPDVGMRNRMVSQERALHMARTSDVRLMEQAAEAKALAELAEPAAH